MFETLGLKTNACLIGINKQQNIELKFFYWIKRFMFGQLICFKDCGCRKLAANYCTGGDFCIKTKDCKLFPTASKLACHWTRHWRRVCHCERPNVRWMVELMRTFFCIWSILARTALVLRTGEEKKNLSKQFFKMWKWLLVMIYIPQYFFLLQVIL